MLPWALSNDPERVDLRNGLAACPMHDAAFDRGYLAVGDTYNILRAGILQESMEQDQRVRPYFDDLLSPVLILPETAKQPAIHTWSIIAALFFAMNELLQVSLSAPLGYGA